MQFLCILHDRKLEILKVMNRALQHEQQKEARSPDKAQQHFQTAHLANESIQIVCSLCMIKLLFH
jgi:hypothetical protein